MYTKGDLCLIFLSVAKATILYIKYIDVNIVSMRQLITLLRQGSCLLSVSSRDSNTKSIISILA